MTDFNWPEPPPQGWWRHEPDWSTLAKPRVLRTILVAPEDQDATVRVWVELLEVAPDARMPIADMGLLVSTVGNVIWSRPPRRCGQRSSTCTP